jgi:hypothetical protein
MLMGRILIPILSSSHIDGLDFGLNGLWNIDTWSQRRFIPLHVEFSGSILAQVHASECLIRLSTFRAFRDL